MVLAMHYCLLYSICFCSPLCSSYHLIIRTLFFFLNFFSLSHLCVWHCNAYCSVCWLLGESTRKGIFLPAQCTQMCVFAYVYFDTHSSGPVQVLHSTQTCTHSVYRFNVVRMQQLSLVLMHSHSVTCFPFDTVFAGTLVHFERRTLCAKSPIDFHTWTSTDQNEFRNNSLLLLQFDPKRKKTIHLSDFSIAFCWC